MIKNLRFLMMGLALVFCGATFAEDIIWFEDWEGYEASANPQGIDPNYTFVGTVLNDDGTVKSGTKIYDNNLAGGTAPELLVAKGNGSFAANVFLNGKSGELTLSFLTNRSDLQVEVTGATLGQKARTGNNDIYPVTVAAGTSQITIKFSMTGTSNARLDDIKLYQGVAKKNAGLSWGTASRSVTIGAEDNLFPTLSNENLLPVTFSSSDTNVATIDASGNITLVASGKTDISASFAGNDEFEAQTVSYTLTVKDAESVNPGPDAQSISVAQALDVINALENGATTTETYDVKGYIVGNPDFQRKAADNTLFGNVNLDIADAEGGSPVLTVFRAKDFGNKNFTEETCTLKAGDLVVFRGKLQKYMNNDVITPELTKGYLISVNGQESGIAAVTIDPENQPVYNLQGQRVTVAQKGIYIIGGKKVVKK